MYHGSWIVFSLPLYCSSVTALSGKNAKDLDQMTREQLKQACGESEGSRIYSLFTVQKGSWKVLIAILLAKINLSSDDIRQKK